MSNDQQLADAAQAMTAAAANGRAVGPLLKKLCPHIYRQILRDRQRPALFSFWGRCVNEDENVGQTIVHPAILAAIGELAGVPMRGRIVHAGLQHTYGYLFSLIDTPYGAKRDRWVFTDLEEGFGIDLSLLGDRPRWGTLLANVTWFLGQIVYRGHASSLNRLAHNAEAVAPPLVDYQYARLRRRRIEEKVILADGRGTALLLTTDLVPFPNSPKERDVANTLLVYSVKRGLASRTKLITAFPVTAEVVDKIRASVSPSGRVKVRLKYNAYVRGLYGCTVAGRRTVIESYA